MFNKYDKHYTWNNSMGSTDTRRVPCAMGTLQSNILIYT